MQYNIKITISYDGTRYLGWQRLGGRDRARSIQGCLEDALEQVIGCRIRITGSGRTDAGVHARGQVANFRVPSAFLRYDSKEQLMKWMRACNRILPEDIRICSMVRVSSDFHSRYSARKKTYVYQVDTGDKARVFGRKYRLWYPAQLDMEKMRRAAKELEGTHDFSAFCNRSEEREDCERTLYELRVDQDGSLVTFTLTADGFLYNMVRILVGTLLEIGEGSCGEDIVKKAFQTGDRQMAGKTVAGMGLCLEQVYYSEKNELESGEIFDT